MSRYHFRAGDKVQHRETGDSFLVACDEEEQHVLAAGPPEKWLSVWDLSLTDPATPGNSLRALKRAAVSEFPEAKKHAQAQLKARGIQLEGES